MPSMLELKIPPVAVTILYGMAMLLLARVAPGLGYAGGWRLLAACALGVAGAAVALAGVWAFRQARTTVNPLNPHGCSTLVASGIYRYSRNPMYLGLLVMLLAWALFLGSPYALLVALAYVPWMNRLQIEPEERSLERVFGEAFNAYRKRVRRWL